MRLPAFDLADYRKLLMALSDAGYALASVGKMGDNPPARVVYLRHDVDFDPRSVLPMAAAEAALGAGSTYYVLLTQHYNALQLENRQAIRSLADLGHEIGLHYDMETYPADPSVARQHLRREVEILSDAAQTSVTTICMHQPSMGAPDPFLSVPGLLHPHDPSFQRGLLYISDSCRGWRDAALVNCVSTPGPRRVLLNTHPELWLDGTVADRMAYLDLLRDRVSGHYREFVDTVVRAAWRSHPGSRLHDERETSSRDADSASAASALELWPAAGAATWC